MLIQSMSKSKCSNRDCPDELKEATSSLIFASSRCGELPESQKMREIFTSKFGQEFAVNAVELHRNNGVNPKVLIEDMAEFKFQENHLITLNFVFRLFR